MHRAQLGLGFIYHGILAIVFAFVVSVLLALCLGVPPLLVMLPGGAALLGIILVFIGPLFCLTVPAESRAKWLVVASVCCQLGAVGLAAVTGIATVAIRPPEILVFLLYGTALLLGIIGFLVFVEFLKRLSEYILRNDLTARAGNLLTASGLYLLAAVGCASILADSMLTFLLVSSCLQPR